MANKTIQIGGVGQVWPTEPQHLDAGHHTLVDQHEQLRLAYPALLVLLRLRRLSVLGDQVQDLQVLLRPLLLLLIVIRLRAARRLRVVVVVGVLLVATVVI